MTLLEKLNDEIDTYNKLVEEEAKIQEQLVDCRNRKATQLGRVQMVDQLYKEDLEEQSKAASSNGHGDPKNIQKLETETEEVSVKDASS